MVLVLGKTEEILAAVRPAEDHIHGFLDHFVEGWTGRRSSRRLPQLIGSLNQLGWRCAIVDGGISTAEWALLTRSGINQRFQAHSVLEGLQSLEAAQESEQFDLIILYDIPCSLGRVQDWLQWTEGRGSVLWVRQSEAVLLEEEIVNPHSWKQKLAWFCDRLLRFLDRWG
ncbi:MAG: hypothetical protein H7Y37_07140 [Anaerolineae bacterium]|nr:hypothetical protein [Gloeobacterales cyanobacterium ES-bin-313]